MPYKDINKNKEYMKLYRETHKQKQKIYQQTYREEKKEQLRLYKEVYYKNVRNKRLLRIYGISLDDYFNFLLKQEGCCCICLTKFSDSIRPYVDHCHITKKVRGLLCFHCNTGLGHFKDNYKNLVKAARYVY